jgi:hypothetical protein
MTTLLKPLPLRELLRKEYRGECVDQIDTLEKCVDELPERPHIGTRSILDEAIECTSGDRRRDYDHARPNHERIAGYWNAHLRAIGITGSLSAADVAMMMILLKVARQARTPKRDNLVDIAGYARCVAQIEEIEP